MSHRISRHTAWAMVRRRASSSEDKELQRDVQRLLVEADRLRFPGIRPRRHPTG